MENITTNARLTARKATRNGEAYLVAPVTLIVEGVLNGSKGPLFYPSEEIENTTDAWDSIPITVNHPSENGSPVSASHGDILARTGIGQLLNPQFSNGRLRGEGWFHIEATERTDNRILDSLRVGKPLELSTGLVTDNEPAQPGASHNGTPYKFIARKYRPDHLAILTDSIGACSLNDGCGVLVNTANELSHEEVRDQLNAKLLERFGPVEEFSTLDRPWVHDIFQNKVIYSHKNKFFRLGYTRAKNKVTLGGTLPVEVSRVTKWQPINNEEKTMAKLTDKQREEIIDTLVGNECCGWTEENRETLNNFDDASIENLKSQADKMAALELTTNEAQKPFTDASGSVHTWNQEKGTWDHKLKEPKKKDEVVKNEDTKPTKMTDEEWFAAAPEVVRNTLSHAKGMVEEAKWTIIEELTTNIAADKQKELKEHLQGQNLDQLKVLRSLAPKPVANVQQAPTSFLGASAPVPTAPTANYDSFEGFGLPGQSGYLNELEDKKD